MGFADRVFSAKAATVTAEQADDDKDGDVDSDEWDD